MSDPESALVAARSSKLGSNQLGVVGISALVISAVAPISVMAAAVPVLFAVTGAAVPAIFLIAGGLYTVFIVGYVAMSRYMVNAGGFVAYVDRAFGVRTATAIAYITVLFYSASIVAFYAISGAVAAMTISPDANITLVTFGYVIIVAVLCLFGVSVSARLLVVLLVVEAASLLVLDVALLLQGGPDGYSLAGFSPDIVFGAGFGVALLLAMICFSGLEATVVFSEEAREPRRTIPRAVYFSLIAVVLLYGTSSWLMSVHVGPSASQIPPEEIGSFFFTIAASAVGDGFSTYLGYLVILSFLALFIGFQNLITRYVFALGRAGVLPSPLGRTNSRRSPVVASLAVSVMIAIVLGAFTFSGQDPFTVTYAWLVGLGTVGLLLSLCVVSVAIVVFFARTKVETNVWTTKVAPIISAVALGAVLFIAIENYSILGNTDDSARSLLIAIPIAAILGWIVAEVRLRSGHTIDYSADLGG